MKIIKKQGCPSFTLMETIMALVIIMVCFGFSAMIYLNVIRADAGQERLKAFMTLKKYSIETHMNKHYFDEEVYMDSLWIKREIRPYRNEPELKILYIEAGNDMKRKLSSYQQIIIAE